MIKIVPLFPITDCWDVYLTGQRDSVYC